MPKVINRLLLNTMMIITLYEIYSTYKVKYFMNIYSYLFFYLIWLLATSNGSHTGEKGGA